jgi:diadenosine tetraphosphate (Ap4A) HIT family hydrolase
VGGLLIVQTEQLRIIRVQGTEAEAFPAFYRVVWNAHVAEWTDLVPAERSQLMQTVAKVETVLRRALQPTKVNLASLGNLVPHLHWHVVARFDWDNRFPAPVWAPPVRANDDVRLAALRDRLPACDAAIASLPF